MDIYVVQAGDTIEKIADMYGVSAEKLIRDNELANPYNLLVGQAIIIVYPSKTYTVVEGDSLVSIARANNITVNELLRNNPFLVDREYIYPGEVLTISFNRSGELFTNGYTNTFINRQILRKTLPYLTYLSIFNYQISSSGDALGTDDDIDIIQTALQYGVIPLMHLTAFTILGEFDLDLTYRLLQDDELQNILFENIVNILKSKGYYGVIISAQYITSENQDLFLNYTRRFSERLKEEGFITHIAIDPKIITLDNSIVLEEIDYSLLSYVVDKILLIEYTWGMVTSPPSPVFSITRLNALLDFIIPQIPPDKISIGIPVVGYMWELPFVPGLSSSSSSLNIDNVINLAVDVQANIQFDSVSQTPYFYFTNSTSENTEYIVRYVNALTVNSLIQTLSERGISSISVWNIMSYFTQLWLVINSQYEIVKLLPEI